MASQSDSTSQSDYSDLENAEADIEEDFLYEDDENLEPIATEEERKLYEDTVAAEEEEEKMLTRRFEEQDVKSWYVTVYRLLAINKHHFHH